MEVERRPGAREAIFAQLVESGRAEQVAQRLADAIILGVLTPGARLPSESELAKRFGVALITLREGLVILRDAGLVETRRGRIGGSFVIAANATRSTLLGARLRGLAQVELSDLAVYFSVIVEGSAERAALRASPIDARRLDAWLRNADFGTTAAARTNAGGFYIELAVLSQSARLVREQIRLQAEFGPLLLLGNTSVPTRLDLSGRVYTEYLRDFRALEWYQVPESTHQTHITGPYVDQLCTCDYILTLTMPVRVDDEMVGVVGTDIYVKRPEREPLPLFLALNEPVVLLNEVGRVVVSTESTMLVGDILPNPQHSLAGYTQLPCTGTPLRIAIREAAAS